MPLQRVRQVRALFVAVIPVAQAITATNMKTLKQIVGIVALTAALNTTQAQSWLTNGLVAYYPFNGNANDASGHTNHGTLNNVLVAFDRFGMPNSAYYFNGSNSFITFPNTPTTNVDNISMFCWVKPTKLPQWGIAITLGTADGNLPCDGFALGIGADYLTNGLLGNRIIGANACVTWVNSDYSFQETSKWHQIGFIRQSGFDYFYVDGQIAGSQLVGSPNPPTKFCIGTLLGSDELNAVFSGFIDDVRLYDRALTASQVEQLFQREAGPTLNAKTAIYLDSTTLSVGANYQIQISGSLNSWTNFGSSFTATNSSWRTTNYWDIENFGQLFFRLQTVP